MDKLLFTPGPLTTSTKVKSEMTRDIGSRDIEFVEIIKEIRERLLQVAGLRIGEGYEVILMQGAGTFGIESVISSSIPHNGKLLAIINGSYGRRMAHIASIHNIPVVQINYKENEIPSAVDVQKVLREDQNITHVCIVHCETTTGIINPIAEIGEIVKGNGMTYIVDAMSSFGAVTVDIKDIGIDFLISS